MEIEQKPPNKPNFLLIVLLTGAVTLVLFAVVFVIMHYEAPHFLRVSPDRHPASELRSPTHSPGKITLS